MSTAPPSPTNPAHEPAPDYGVVLTMAISAVVYPPVVGTVMLISVVMVGLSAYYEDSNPLPLFGMTVLVVTGGSHLLILSVLRRLHTPGGWKFPTVLSTAVLLANVQAFVALEMGVQIIWFLPLTCLLLSLFGAAGWALARKRRKPRLLSALAAILAAALLLTGACWVSEKQEDREEREELVRGLADFSLPIAVLDSPEWDPSNMQIIDSDAQRESLDIDYVPVDPSPELEGFSLTLRSEALATTAGPGWPPLRELCRSEDGPWACEEHGDAVIATSADDEEIEMVQARLEITAGIAAYLTTDMPTDRQGAPTMEFPDIDMAELSEHIRLAEPGEAEEIAIAATD